MESCLLVEGNQDEISKLGYILRHIFQQGNNIADVLAKRGYVFNNKQVTQIP